MKTIMKAFLIFLGLAVTSEALFGFGEKNECYLRIKFGVSWTPWDGKDYFMCYDMTKPEAIEKGYVKTPRPEGPMPELELYCPKEDKTICLFFDKETGHICGLNVGIRKDAISNAAFDWKVQGWADWEVPSEDGSTVSYISIQQFYCSAEFLKKTPEDRTSCRKENKILPEKAIWLTGFNSVLDRISLSEDTMPSSDYTKQAFMPAMGTHHYFNMTPSTTCEAYTIYPWFTLAHKDEVMGTGLMMFGKLDDNTLLESPSKAAVEAIVPHGPKCLYDLAEKPGVRTLHIYYHNSPWSVLLPFGK